MSEVSRRMMMFCHGELRELPRNTAPTGSAVRSGPADSPAAERPIFRGLKLNQSSVSYTTRLSPQVTLRRGLAGKTSEPGPGPVCRRAPWHCATVPLGPETHTADVRYHWHCDSEWHDSDDQTAGSHPPAAAPPGRDSSGPESCHY
eukprot:568094-Hanusia_phi.AAC.1